MYLYLSISRLPLLSAGPLLCRRCLNVFAGFKVNEAQERLLKCILGLATCYYVSNAQYECKCRHHHGEESSPFI